MGLPSEINRLFAGLLYPVNVTLASLPANVVGVTVTGAAGANAKGAWAVVAATVGSADVLVTGMFATLDQVDDYHFDLGSGAAGAEVVLVANVPMSRIQVTAVGQLLQGPHFWPFAVLVKAGVALSARLASVGGGSDTALVTAMTATGF